MIKHFLYASLALFVLILTSCTDSDQYLYDESSASNVEVEAYMAHSFEQETDRSKVDTIVAGDSLFFLTSIYPSKSIRLKRYYWDMDGEFFANEFSFKSTVLEQGVHQIYFILIDYFGDTITDTLTLYVGTPPSLKDADIIPRDSTLGLDASQRVSFSWNSKRDSDLWQISYRFTLKKFGNENPLIDTLINTSYFIYNAGLEPLQEYLWEVSAVNELNMAAEDTIRATFFTESYGNEGFITGSVQSDVSTDVMTFTFTNLSDSTTFTRKNTIPESATPSEDNREFYLSPIPEGDYQLTCSIDSLSDYKSNTVHVSIRKDHLTSTFLTLGDSTVPTIRSITGNDTLDIADTLRFIVTDGGGDINLSRTSVSIEDRNLGGIKLSGDTLIVPLTLSNAWTVKRLKVSTQDPSENRATVYFYLRPNATLEEVAND